MSQLPRHIRYYLAERSIEELATDYVVMTESMTVKVHDTVPPTAEMVVARPRLYGTQDLKNEIMRRIDMPNDWVLKEVAFEEIIEKARQIYHMLGG